MIFRKPQKQIKLPIVKINGIQIVCVDNFNFLGVIIDKNLNWKNHLNKVSNKIVRIIGIMNKLKFTLPQNILINIYNSLIIPHINYCIFLWGSENNRVCKLQKRAVRIIRKESRLSHTDPIFNHLVTDFVTFLSNCGLAHLCMMPSNLVELHIYTTL